MNNYEKIRNMSIEEMARWLCKKELDCDHCMFWYKKDCGINNPFIEWLKEEV